MIDPQTQQPIFPWDFVKPTDAYWKDVNVNQAKSFHTWFAAEEIGKMGLDPNQSEQDKYQTMLNEFNKKLAAREAEVAPKTLTEADFKQWSGLLLGKSGLLRQLGQQQEADAIIKTLVNTADPNTGAPNVLAKHSFVHRTYEHGDFADAESLALELLPFEEAHENLGPHSPQALDVLRLLIKSRCKQGKVELAKEDFKRLVKLTEEQKDTKFQKYHSDEVEQNSELVKETGIEN